jgi:hypothetical protein
MRFKSYGNTGLAGLALSTAAVLPTSLTLNNLILFSDLICISHIILRTKIISLKLLAGWFYNEEEACFQ